MCCSGFLSFDKALLGLLEVDDIPDGVEILCRGKVSATFSSGRRGTYISLDIQVLQVERVLPDINTDDRDVREQGVLVRSGGDLKAFGGRVVALRVIQ